MMTWDAVQKALFAPQAFVETCDENAVAEESYEESLPEEPFSDPAMEWYVSGTKCQFGSEDRVFKRTGGDLKQCLGACFFYSEACRFFSYDATNRVCIGCAVEPTEIDENYETYAMVSGATLRPPSPGHPGLIMDDDPETTMSEF